MATTSDLNRVAAIVLRQMRGPILLLVAVYAIGMTGMALMPGQDADGNPQRMSLFHAFYFLTYTATTTGFGEIPAEFTEAQRLWAILCLYLGVVAWIYAIGSIIHLIQNPHFLRAVAERQFAHGVRNISQPFFIICGFGDTGSLLARGLSDEYRTGVIIDSDPERIKALKLRDYRVTMLGLCADASVPKHLLDAGLQNPLCQAVVALTNDEHINLKIAVMVRYLNPQVRLICRSTSPRHQEELAMLESVTVVDPFENFAHQLSAALYAPRWHILNYWLVGAREINLDRVLQPPRGTWILCGYGRMGSRLYQTLRQHQVAVVVIEPCAEKVTSVDNAIVSHTTDKALREAGIEQAVGIVAGTDSDSDNLSILLRARSLNSRLFLVVRQNRHENELAFNAANADLIMQPSLVTARKILLILIAPMILPFLEYLRENHRTVLEGFIERLRTIVGDAKPGLWTAELNATDASALVRLWQNDYSVVLADIQRDPNERAQPLPCMPLMLIRNRQTLMLPYESQTLQQGDCILFCGTQRAEQMVQASLNNDYTLHYLVTGQEEMRSTLLKWLLRSRLFNSKRALSKPF